MLSYDRTTAALDQTKYRTEPQFGIANDNVFTYIIYFTSKGYWYVHILYIYTYQYPVSNYDKYVLPSNLEYKPHQKLKIYVFLVSSCNCVCPINWRQNVASLTKEVKPRLAERPLKINGRLANRGLTSLVKEAAGGKSGMKM